MVRWLLVGALTALCVGFSGGVAVGETAPNGTYLMIELAEPVSTRTHARGDTFAIRLAEPLVIEDRQVAPAGALGLGQVVDAAKAGLMGKPAKLVLAARYLDIEGRRAPLRGMQLGRRGHDNSDAALATSFIPYVGLAFFLIRGGDIELAEGVQARVRLAADVEFVSNAMTPEEQTP